MLLSIVWLSVIIVLFYMTGLENFTDKFSKEELLNFRPEKVGKISSKSDYQIMLLEKTPKIIFLY